MREGGIRTFVACLCMLAALTATGAGCAKEEPKITVEAARAELNPTAAGIARAYLVIRNSGGEDAVKEVRTSIPGSIAFFSGLGGTDLAKGEGLRVGARTAVELRPGGPHIVISNMPKETLNGMSFNLTLVLERTGERQVPLTLQHTGSGRAGDGRGVSVRD